MVHFIKILSVVAFFAVTLIMSGCGASSEVNTTEDYENGKVEAGWLTGMSPERMKEFYDGRTDSETKKKYSELFFKQQENKSNSEQNSVNDFEVGKIIIANSTTRTVTIGIEGPVERSWTFDGKGIFREVVPPGEYYQWWEQNGKRKYKIKTYYQYDERGKKKKVEEYDILKVEATSISYFNGEAANGVINFHNR